LGAPLSTDSKKIGTGLSKVVEFRRMEGREKRQGIGAGGESVSRI